MSPAPITRAKRARVNCRKGGPIHLYLTERGWQQVAVVHPTCERVIVYPPKRSPQT